MNTRECIFINTHEIVFTEKKGSAVSAHLLFLAFFFPFIFISWRLITLQYYSGFCQIL